MKNKNYKTTTKIHSKKMKVKTFIISAIAVMGVATPVFAKTKTVKNTENNVSSDTEQVAEHDKRQSVSTTSTVEFQRTSRTYASRSASNVSHHNMLAIPSFQLWRIMVL